MIRVNDLNLFFWGVEGLEEGIGLLCDPFKNWAACDKQAHRQTHAPCVRAVSGSGTCPFGHQILPRTMKPGGCLSLCVNLLLAALWMWYAVDVGE